MTNKEALQAVVDGLQFSDIAFTKALLDRDLSATAIYSSDDAKEIDLCAVELLYAAYTQADVQEGDFSYSHPDFLRKVEARLLYLAKKHGINSIVEQFEKPAPTITDASSLW